MIWSTFSFPYNKTYTVVWFEKLLCKIMEKYREAIIGFSWKAVLQTILQKSFFYKLSFDWSVFLCVKWIKVILYVLVWCIYSHTCTGPVCWWTCSSFPKGKCPVHYLIWNYQVQVSMLQVISLLKWLVALLDMTQIMIKKQRSFRVFIVFWNYGRRNGLAWVPHPLRLLGDCCQFYLNYTVFCCEQKFKLLCRQNSIIL